MAIIEKLLVRQFRVPPNAYHYTYKYHKNFWEILPKTRESLPIIYIIYLQMLLMKVEFYLDMKGSGESCFECFISFLTERGGINIEWPRKMFNLSL